ncbi:MAG: methyl-accepting chemotaxis protein [Oscillospiraceae bacterium]|nr:methyl-accepting chemotaxis protein [Oscillospiraceae bacterium]
MLPVSEERKRQLIEKGQADFRFAVMIFMQTQGFLCTYATKVSITGIARNLQCFESEIKKIDTVSSKIKGISRKTQMLSINAAIEAAHASNTGKGFGVVAEEIGNLSKQTTECTDEVNDINKNMLKVEKASSKDLVGIEENINRYFEETDAFFKEYMKRSSIEDNGFVLTTLALRLVDHSNFLRGIFQNESVTTVTDYMSCALGKWFEGNMTTFRNISGFSAIYDAHRAFHETGQEYVNDRSIDNLNALGDHSKEILGHFISLFDAFVKELEVTESYFEV